MMFLLNLLARLSLPILHGIGFILGWLIYWIPGRHSKRMRDNVFDSGLCVPGRDCRRLLRQSISESGKAFAELLPMWLHRDKVVLKQVRGSSGWEHIDAAQAALQRATDGASLRPLRDGLATAQAASDQLGDQLATMRRDLRYQEQEAEALRDEIIAANDADWDSLVARCLAPADRPVFYQKHMTHHMLDGFGLDWADGAVNAFLIRDPGRVLASYVVKRGEVSLAASLRHCVLAHVDLRPLALIAVVASGVADEELGAGIVVLVHNVGRPCADLGAHLHGGVGISAHVELRLLDKDDRDGSFNGSGGGRDEGGEGRVNWVGGGHVWGGGGQGGLI